MTRIRTPYLLPIFFAFAIPIGQRLHHASLVSRIEPALAAAAEGLNPQEILERSQRLLWLGGNLDNASSVICRGGEVLASLPAWLDPRVPLFCADEAPGWREFVVSLPVTAGGDRIVAYGKTALMDPGAASNALTIALVLAFVALLIELWLRDAWLLRRSIDEVATIVGAPGQTASRGRFFRGDVKRHAQDLAERLHALRAEQVANETKAKIGEIGLQVAHDIRSPLTVLEYLGTDLKELSAADRHLFRSAVDRVRTIAADLTRLGRRGEALSYREPQGPTAPVSTPLLVWEVVTEKRFVTRQSQPVCVGFDLNDYLCGGFAQVEPVEFRRVISNLIDNAIQAMPAGGAVGVTVVADNAKVHVRIADQGAGFTLNSSASLGLGLTHAKAKALAWRGALSVERRAGGGSLAVFSVPLATPPPWYANAIQLPERGRVVCLMEDRTHRNDLMGKLSAAGAAPDLAPYDSWGDVEDAFLCGQLGTQPLFLVEGSFVKQWPQIEALGIGTRTILICEDMGEPAVKEARRLGFKVIPRAMAGIIPLIVAQTSPGLTQGLRASGDDQVALQ